MTDQGQITEHQRSLKELENDITRIDEALCMVSELRTALRGFRQVIQDEKNNAQYVQTFNDQLNAVKRGLQRLATESDGLKGALAYARSKADISFDWLAIKSAMDTDEDRQSQADDSIGRQKEPGMIIKEKAERVYRQLSGIVLSQHDTQNSMAPSKYISNQIELWLTHEKPKDVEVLINYDKEEHKTFVGSSCSVTIMMYKALKASLDLDYYAASDTLVIHRYEISSTKDDGLHHLLFQKLNVLADNAFQDMTVMPAKEALSSILNWIASYHDLFTEPCCRCHRRLQFDSPQYKYLPPIVRTWVRKKIDYMEPDREMPQAYVKAGMAYHMLCFAGATKVATKTT